MTRRSLAAAAIAALLGCGSNTAPHPTATAAASTPVQTAAPAPSPVRIAHLPPTAKDVIDAAIASGNVPLSVSPTCAHVGTEPGDATIGRYLAGFLAELSSPSKKNWIETNVAPGHSAAGEDVSVCRLTLRHEDGDDRWGWGVQFEVRTRDGVVLPQSFTCLGAG